MLFSSAGLVLSWVALKRNQQFISGLGTFPLLRTKLDLKIQLVGCIKIHLSSVHSSPAPRRPRLLAVELWPSLAFHPPTQYCTPRDCFSTHQSQLLCAAQCFLHIPPQLCTAVLCTVLCCFPLLSRTYVILTSPWSPPQRETSRLSAVSSSTHTLRDTVLYLCLPLCLISLPQLQLLNSSWWVSAVWWLVHLVAWGAEATGSCMCKRVHT